MISSPVSSLEHLVYLSRARHGLGSVDVRAILGSAQVNNRRKDVTGLLLFTGRHFLQVLEGRVADLDVLVRVIQRDERHECLNVLSRQIIKRRRYGEWAMGFAESLDDADALESIFPETDPDLVRVSGILERAARTR